MIYYSFIYLILVAVAGTTIKKILFKKSKGASLILSLLLSVGVLLFTAYIFVYIENMQMTAVAKDMQLPIIPHTNPNFTFAFVAAFVFFCAVKKSKEYKSKLKIPTQSYDDDKNNPWLK